MTLAPNTSGERHWTVSDYMALEDDQRYEVYAGDLVMVPSPNIFHQRALTRLSMFVGAYVVEHELGECFDAPFDVVLAEDTIVQPDFTYVRGDRLAELYDGHCITGAPDLVIEVLSTSTESRDRHRKRQLYAQAGVEWLLFVEPKGRVVEVMQLNDSKQYVTVNTAADDDEMHVGLFPELTIDLSKVWFVPPQ
jgi:Uma2 family endonuclease